MRVLFNIIFGLFILYLVSGCRASQESSQIEYSQALFPNLDINLNQSGLDFTKTNENLIYISSQITISGVSVTPGSNCPPVGISTQGFQSPISLFIPEEPGSLTLSFQATTSWGFPSECITKTFTIDRESPLLSDPNLLMTKPFTNRLDQSPHFYWNQAIDNQAGLDHYLFGISDENDVLTVDSWLPLNSLGQLESARITQLNLTHGQSYFGFLKAVDRLGNTSLPITSNSWLVDTIMPQLSGDLEFDWFTDLRALPSIKWREAVDVNSGIDSYQYSWGSQPGLRDVIDWSSAASSMAPSQEKFLTQLTSIYPSLRVTDRAGNQVIKSSDQGVLAVREWESKSQNWDIAGDVQILKADRLGRVLMGGSQVNTISHHRFGLIAMNELGQSIPEKNTNVGFDGPVYVHRVLSDGKMLIGGGFNHYNGSKVAPIIKLNADLTLDTGFQVNFNFMSGNYIYDLDLQGTNVIIVGEFAGRILRLQSNGLVDSTFVVDQGFNDVVSVVKVNPVTSEIFCGGRFGLYKNQPVGYVIRLNSQGSPVSWLTPFTINGWVFALAFDASGNVLVGGYFSSPRRGLVKINLDGSLATAFNSNLGEMDLIDTNLVSQVGQSYIDNIRVRNGAIYVSGQFNRIGGHTTSMLAKINESGFVDTTYSVSGAPSIVTPPSIGILPRTALHIETGTINPGSIWAFLEFNNEPPSLYYLTATGVKAGQVRSNPDQVFYTTFNYSNISSLQKIGNVIYLAGDITFAGENNQSNYLIRVLSDGQVDTDFKQKQGLGFNSGTLQSLIEYGNDYIICGSFRSYQGQSNSGVIRINSNTANAQNIIIPTTNPASAGIECALQTVGSEDYILMMIGQGSFSDGQKFKRFLISNQAIDTNFTTSIPASQLLSHLNVDSSGSFYFVERSSVLDYGQLSKFLPTGLIDASFGQFSFSFRVQRLKLESSILTVAGEFDEVTVSKTNPISTETSQNRHYARIDQQGNLRPPILHEFDSDVTYMSDIHSMGDDQLFAIGSLYNFDTQSVFKFIKLNSAGQADSKFNLAESINNIPANVISNSLNERILVQNNGNIWLVANTMMKSKNRAARLIRIAPKN